MTDIHFSMADCDMHFGSIGTTSNFKQQSQVFDSSGALPRNASQHGQQRSVLSSSEKVPTAGGLIDPLYVQLWHACAGSLVSLPSIGSRVVYFPQGHIEQVAACTNQEADVQIPHSNLPGEILCRLLNMTLSADKETDEVYAQMTLVPENEKIDVTSDMQDEAPFCIKKNMHMFVKTLTASDTSTHGGFSVPRRAAEECLPVLDFEQSPPTQDLIAKDLHGIEWRFRHIYRGHPKRHLLTTGWSVFVSQKRLVAGDTVIFLRGDNGELRIGVRRAVRQQNSVTSSSLLSSHSMHLGVLAAAAHAVSTKTMFSIFYNPRTSPAEFVVPYHKYVKSLTYDISVGMRFKMRFETEEPTEGRYIGTITAVADFDSPRWPNSKWRCLKVGWDEQSNNEKMERVSPWEIEPFIASEKAAPSEPRSTRPRLSAFPSIDISLLNAGSSHLDLVSMLQAQKALQSNHDAGPPGTLVVDKEEGIIWGVKQEDRASESAGCSKAFVLENWTQVARADPVLSDGFSLWKSACSEDFQMSMCFPAQSPEMHKEKGKLHSKDRITSKLCSFPYNFSARSMWVDLVTDPENQSFVTSQELHPSYESSLRSAMLSTTRSSLLLPLGSPASTDGRGSNNWLSSSQSPCCLESSSVLRTADIPSSSHSRNEALYKNAPSEQLSSTFKTCQAQEISNLPPLVADQNCKIFGFALTGQASKNQPINSEGTKHVSTGNFLADLAFSGDPNSSSNWTEQVQKPPMTCRAELAASETRGYDLTVTRFSKEPDGPQAPLRTRIKVYKQGAVGRTIDLSKLEGYDALRQVLGELFKLEGVLNEVASGWQLVYTDHEGDLLLVGDDPWTVFCSFLRKIHIFSPAEVEKMAQETLTTDPDHNHRLRESSKCFSDHQDSAPTTPRGSLFEV